ncbi:MAG: acyl-ACP desaturase [Acidimicrobiaceae bacterium]|nr:acyl-ACP desaturase [Acidimicrobiaceae bacterium]MYL03996.1 acyl-ACP desaturase [Acidimicrobiaceae bacterium]
MPTDADVRLLADLEPSVERLYERHLQQTREWHPHALVPWSRGEDYAPDYEWSPDDAGLSPEARSALFVNVLTEDNLPYYFRDIERMFGRDGAWGHWVRRWTAEEGRHGQVIHDYLAVTRSVDPVSLERARMAQVQSGEAPAPPNALEGLAYVTLQELATRISHFNTGKHIADPAGRAIMRRVAFDENLHFLFYRDAMAAALEVEPSQAVVAIANQVKGFAMPGVGITDFEAHARTIADAGIYDLAIHHDQILQPVLMRDWKLPNLTGLSGVAEAARERLMRLIDRIGRVGRLMVERRADRRARSPHDWGLDRLRSKGWAGGTR